MDTEGRIDEAYTLAKRGASPYDFVGHLISEIKKEKIDFIINDERSKGKISD
jgi:hypothetical protein